jgi:lycopene cyclase domain-containing protein
MAVARHGTGPAATVRALWSQVHPVFMLPPVAASLFGGVLADRLGPASAVHAVAIFAAVYTAHVRDGYVDFHVRDEDEDHPLTPGGCRAALAGSTALFAAALAGVFLLGGPLAALVTLPTWFIGYLHAGVLDVRPLAATADYAAGIALAILGGYAAAAGTVAPLAVSFAVVFFVVLAGVKVVDDAQDYEYDRSIQKRTLAVALGRGRAWEAAYGLVFGGLGLAVVLAVGGALPRGVAVAALAVAAVAAAAARSPDPELATKLLVRGAYVFLALSLVAVYYRPLAGPLPDIGVLGPYTYLATEVLWGGIAVALLWRAGRAATRRTLLTVAALYPIAFTWDWYTLRVGVFEIPLRTGVELLGIPLEEHVFMLVVPALVLGMHENLHGRGDGNGNRDRARAGDRVREKEGNGDTEAEAEAETETEIGAGAEAGTETGEDRSGAG